MRMHLALVLGLVSLVLDGVCASDWNILHHKGHGKGLKISLKNYCESWRVNVEVHNLRDFEVVPHECVEYIGKYMTSTQYKVDSERALEQCTLYLSQEFVLTGDGNDAWIFDVDDTLLSNIPYYKKHQYGGEKLNSTSLEGWMRGRKAPALASSLSLYNEIKGKGIKIFLISNRGEHLRDATVDNLFEVGYTGWTGLILRGDEDCGKSAQKYKAEKRQKLVEEGYRIWGIVGDQWSSLLGHPHATRTFKLPNSMYYA